MKDLWAYRFLHVIFHHARAIEVVEEHRYAETILSSCGAMHSNISGKLVRMMWENA